MACSSLFLSSCLRFCICVFLFPPPPPSPLLAFSLFCFCLLINVYEFGEVLKAFCIRNEFMLKAQFRQSSRLSRAYTVLRTECHFLLSLLNCSRICTARTAAELMQQKLHKFNTMFTRFQFPWSASSPKSHDSRSLGTAHLL